MTRTSSSRRVRGDRGDALPWSRTACRTSWKPACLGFGRRRAWEVIDVGDVPGDRASRVRGRQRGVVESTGHLAPADTRRTERSSKSKASRKNGSPRSRRAVGVGDVAGERGDRAQARVLDPDLGRTGVGSGIPTSLEPGWTRRIARESAVRAAWRGSKGEWDEYDEPPRNSSTSATGSSRRCIHGRGNGSVVGAEPGSRGSTRPQRQGRLVDELTERSEALEAAGCGSRRRTRSSTRGRLGRSAHTGSPLPDPFDASASASFCFRSVTVARLHDRCSGCHVGKPAGQPASSTCPKSHPANGSIGLPQRQQEHPAPAPGAHRRTRSFLWTDAVAMLPVPVVGPTHRTLTVMGGIFRERAVAWAVAP